MKTTSSTNGSASTINQDATSTAIVLYRACEKGYRIDPLFAAIMPPLGEENYLALKENVRRDGNIISPLIVWQETGILLDGHHRERAYRELRAVGENIPEPQIAPRSFTSKVEAEQWVLEHAKGTRQNFGTFQKIQQLISNQTLMADLTEAAKKSQLAGRPLGASVAPSSENCEDVGATADPSSNETTEVARVLARVVGCSETTAKEAIAVRRHGKSHPKFLEAVVTGEVTPHSAYKAIRRAVRVVAKQGQIAQNMPAAHEAVKAAAETGGLLGKVHHSDVFVGMPLLQDKSISLIFTSPPYALTAVKYANAEVEPFFDGDYDKYLGKMRRLFAECKRVLVRGGKLVMNFDNVNVPPEERKGNEVRYDCRRDFANIAAELGFIFVDEYIWSKQNAVGDRPAIGTKGSPAGHRVNNNTEYVVIWTNELVNKEPQLPTTPENDRIDLMEEEQFSLSMQLWKITPARRAATDHPAAFPRELARRVIRLYTFVGDTVCDPFSGTGTTGVMAVSMGRHFVGFEVAKEWAEGANQQIQEALKSPLPVEPTPEWSDQREIKRAKNNEILKSVHRAKYQDKKRQKKTDPEDAEENGVLTSDSTTASATTSPLVAESRHWTT